MTPGFAKKIVTSLFLLLSACQSIAAEPTNNATGTDKPAATNAAIATETSETSSTDKPAPATETVKADTYVVQPGDVIQVDVWREPNLLRELTVRPDGGINFPLIGEMTAAGKTVQQLQNDLRDKLQKYVPEPVVTISVKLSSGNKIYVVGKVNRPGEFVATRNMDVMQALSMAGGLNPYASENKIKILRRINGEQKTFMFKYSQVEKGKNLEQNIVLQGGDVVVVP